MLSSKGLPANRESEARDANTVLEAGFTALAMRDDITVTALECYRRQYEFMSRAITKRYQDRAVI